MNATKSKWVDLYRIFSCGDQQHDFVQESEVEDLVNQDRVVYAATLQVEEGVPCECRIRGDQYNASFSRLATEAAQELFG